MPTSTPFRVECPPQLLERLKNRLSDVIYADESLPDSDTWAYGMPPRVLRPLVDYWRTQYDWKKWEARINEVGSPIGLSNSGTWSEPASNSPTT
jgi:hypothetical protein